MIAIVVTYVLLLITNFNIQFKNDFNIHETINSISLIQIISSQSNSSLKHVTLRYMTRQLQQANLLS